MKIKLYGTNSFTAKGQSACAMIDDTILFDCPPDLMKKLKNEPFDIKKIKAIVISHFHADHDFDLPMTLFFANPLITIIAPRGATLRYKMLCHLSHFTGAISTIDKCTIIEIDKKVLAEGVEIDGYKI